MNQGAHFNERLDMVCPSPLIGEYLDGELQASDQKSFERHLAECEVCSSVVLEQRQMLCLLNGSLRSSGEVVPPVDFARTVAVRAESTVNGLRHPEERLNAYFLVSAMALFCLFAFFSFADVAALLSKAVNVLTGIFAVTTHIVRSFYSGIVILARSASSPLSYALALSMIAAAAFALVFPAIRRLSFRKG